jgi:putative two-component system response regulator
MQRHPEFGVRILGDNPYYAMARDIALYHHENVDGSGYPHGLKGEAIPLAARIAKVADVFDALTSQRPYKEAWSTEQTLQWMLARRGAEFDVAVIDALQQLAQQGELARIMLRYDCGQAAPTANSSSNDPG